MTYLDGVHGIIAGGILLSTEIECGYKDGVLQLYNIRQEDRERKISLRRAAGSHKIASYLRDHGADVEVIDYAYVWTLEELKDLWKSRYHSKTLFFGISTSFHQASGYLWQFVEWLRDKYPHITIIGGTQSIDKLLPFYCDWYIFGYGEVAALELVKSLKEGTTSKIKHHNINGKKVINAQQDYKAFPKKDLSVRYEDRDFIKPHEVLDLEFSRGCIFKCAFCTYPILGVRDDHSRHEDNLYRELLENYERWGTTRYNISDETVNDYHKKLARYADVVKKLPFKPDLQGYARGDILVATKKHWETYSELGFMSHFYGIESLHHPSAKAIGKGMDSGKLKEGLLEFKEWAYKNNDNGFYTAMISLIAGLPNETYDSLDEGVEWLKTHWNDQFAAMGILQIHMPNVFSLYKDIAKGLGNISLIEQDPEKYGYKILGPSPMKPLYTKPGTTHTDLKGIYKAPGVSMNTDEGNTMRFAPPIPSRSQTGTSTYRGTGMTINRKPKDTPPVYDDDLLKPEDGGTGWFNNAAGATESVGRSVQTGLLAEKEFKQHNDWESNKGLNMSGIEQWMISAAKKYNIPDMPTITQGSVASWNQVEFYVDPSVEQKDMMKKGNNKYKVNADTLTRTIQGPTGLTENGIQFGSGGDRGAQELYYHKKKFLQQYKRDKLNA